MWKGGGAGVVPRSPATGARSGWVALFSFHRLRTPLCVDLAIDLGRTSRLAGHGRACLSPASGQTPCSAQTSVAHREIPVHRARPATGATPGDCASFMFQRGALRLLTTRRPDGRNTRSEF
jgi:hypothetical protein